MNLLILFILFISTSRGENFCKSDENCTLGKCVIYTSSNSYCACPSGVSGTNCEVPVPFSCGTINTTVPSSVDFEHYRDEYNIQLRFDTALSSKVLGLQFSIGKPVGADSACSYPGVYCEHTVEKCADVYTCEIPWDVAQKCGWTNGPNHTLNAVVNFRVDVLNDDGSQTQTTFTSNLSFSEEPESTKLSLLAMILIIVVAVFLGLIVPIGLVFVFRYIYLYFWKEKEEEDYQTVVPPGELKPTKSNTKTVATKVKGLEDSDPVIESSDSTSVSSDQE